MIRLLSCIIVYLFVYHNYFGACSGVINMLSIYNKYNKRTIVKMYGLFISYDELKLQVYQFLFISVIASKRNYLSTLVIQLFTWHECCNLYMM